jgi:hypothetical protein
MAKLQLILMSQKLIPWLSLPIPLDYRCRWSQGAHIGIGSFRKEMGVGAGWRGERVVLFEGRTFGCFEGVRIGKTVQTVHLEWEEIGERREGREVTDRALNISPWLFEFAPRELAVR